MKKEDISTIENDIKSFKRVRRVVYELIDNFPDELSSLKLQEEFVQLFSARLFLDKTIDRLQKFLDKS